MDAVSFLEACDSTSSQKTVLIAEDLLVYDEDGGDNGHCRNCCGEVVAAVAVLGAAVVYIDVYGVEVEDAEVGDVLAGLMVERYC